MHKRHKYDIISILSVLALSISLFLAVSHFLGITVPCTVTGGCEEVLNSKYAVLLGIPLSVWGVLFFSFVFVLSMLSNHYLIARKILTYVLVLGSLGAASFLTLQFFVIKQVCQYCAVIDVLAIVTMLFDINIETSYVIEEKI